MWQELIVKIEDKEKRENLRLFLINSSLDNKEKLGLLELILKLISEKSI